MQYFMLASAIMAALGGVMALAFRVVRLPRGSQGKRGATSARTATTREPTQVLLNHVTNEYKRHTMALREAQNLRRARNEPEALFRLVNERIQHAEAARRLGQHVQPTLGGRVRQWIDQARLDVMADTVRREVAEVRLPTQSRPLTQGRGLGRLITWARGGPQMGAPHELALYHRDQREHYRLAMVQARRFVREQKQAEARASLATEQTHHLRMSRALKGRFASGLADGVSNDGATDPALTAILN
ncbi:MAG TPA: hypothetical protein VIG77_06480 [Ktedonobacterales bacterium]|jgi:hypothetical protein